MTKQLRRLMVGVLALAAVTACDDGTDPIATGTVQVLAFVDADNSNDFSATDDDPISGATVTLTAVGDDTNTLTATTSADGVAAFSNVEVGSYTASIEVPASLTGVTLASASAPTVAVEYGASATASFRYTYVPGTITGHAFVGSGAWAEGAPVVPGLTVTVSDGTAEWTAETDASGAFTVQGLLPGDYTVTIDVPPFLSGTGSQTVIVTADADATADFGFDTTITHTVPEVRAAAEETMVSVVGVATTGMMGDGGKIDDESFFLQAEGEGILVYLGDPGTVEMGDEVLVYGERTSFAGEIEIAPDAVVVLGEGTLPDPTPLTVGDLNTNEYQGLLISLDDVLLDSIDGGTIYFSELASGVSGSGYAPSISGIDRAATFTPGSVYDLTGVVSIYQDLPQIELRMPSDVVEETATFYTIADARAEAAGTEVTVTGVVSSGNTAPGNLDNDTFYMQDATAGVWVYLGALTETLSIGDLVTVTGSTGVFQGKVQIGATEVLTLDTGVPVEPTVVTLAEVLGGDHQGELGLLVGVEVVSASGSSAYVTDQTDTVQIYLGATADITGSDLVVGELYNITGIVTRYFDNFQVQPRTAEDVDGDTSGTVPTAMSIADARAAAIGTLVEVSGVVTVDSTHFGGTNYIQDSEAGISIYWAGDVVEGDQVTVIGAIDEYQGNVQIALDSIITTGTAAVPAPVVVTGAQVVAGDNPGELVTLEAFTVVDVEALDFDNHIVTGTDAAGDTVMVYVDSRNGMASSDWTVATEYTVTGIMGHRTAGWFVWPRKPADVTAN